MESMLFGDWKQHLTEEGKKLSNEILEALKSEEKDEFKEVMIKNILKMRDDISREELIEIFKDYK